MSAVEMIKQLTGASAVRSRSSFVLNPADSEFGCSFYDGIILIPPHARGY
jgi:hypothetical protein